ncbi:MAG: hypothetical protein KC657_34205 [Myxococcales bacterium]|nr:hypothetical protein [Myxococcales bacterium]
MSRTAEPSVVRAHPWSSRVLGAALVALGVAACALPGCGDANPNNPDFGQPPDPNTFNPGNGGADGYGSGGNVGGPPICPDELKACAHEITYPAGAETAVELRGDFGGPGTWDKGVPMQKVGASWTASIVVPFNKPVQYKFCIDPGADGKCASWKVDSSQPLEPVTPGANCNANPNDDCNNIFAGKQCDPAICNEQGALPPGVFDWRDSVIYFTFVDRFLDGNPANNCNVAGVSGPIANYQGGDWAGVRQKINDGYFQSLGVNTLWVTVPFNNFDGAGKGVGGDTHMYSASHGYWPKLDAANPATLEYESCFGTGADLKGLVDDAHAKDMKVLIDFAMVHVHISSQVFQQHNDWFWPLSFNGGNCVCDDSGVCPWGPQGHRCWFTDYLPHWNYTNPQARDWATTNAVEWVKQLGVDGFRADAIKHVDISWLQELRTKLEAQVHATQTPKQRFYMVGETYDFGNRDLLKGFVDSKTKLDGQFDFPLRRHIAEAVLMRTMKMSDLAAFMNGNDFYYGADAVMSTWIGNHDLPRVIHLAQNQPLWNSQYSDGKDRAWQNQPGAVGEREAFERVANGFSVIFTNRGAPLIYYGDEIGLPGAGDPDNRRFMQWAGYDANQTYLLERIKKLGQIRKDHPSLRRGIRTTLDANDDLWVFSRSTTGDTVYVAINRGDSDKTTTALPGGQLTELITGAVVSGPNATIPARQTRIYVTK